MKELEGLDHAITHEIPLLKIVLARLELLRVQIDVGDWMLIDKVLKCLESLNV